MKKLNDLSSFRQNWTDHPSRVAQQDRGVQGPVERSGTCCDVDITERANGLVPPAMRSDGDATTYEYNGRVIYLGI
jgi:hypothetical protein